VTDSLKQVSGQLRIVSLCTLASRVLGLLRDQAMSTQFGAGPLLDAFTVAFRIPNLARVLLGEGALTTAFVPVFVESLQKDGSEAAARVTWAVFAGLAAVLSGLVIAGELILGLALFCGGWNPETHLLLRLSALLLPYVLLICLAAQLGAVLNALGRFFWPALVPVVLNVVWLGALWWVIPHVWSEPEAQIEATAVCVVLAGGLQLAFLLPILWRCGYGYRSDWATGFRAVSRIACDMLPVVVGLSITQINAVLDSFVAWGFARPPGGNDLMPLPGSPPYPLESGTATALYLGQRLYQFPLGVFGVALGTVLFPLLTRHAQGGDLPGLRRDVSLGLRLVLAIGIPASAGLMLIAHPLTTFFFQYGKFDAAAARQTAEMIVCYGSGVWAYCALLILQRGFYALGDRTTPMRIGLAALVANLFLNLTLIWPLGGRGVALSTALVSAAQAIATGWSLQRRTGPFDWPAIGSTFRRTLLATAVMSVTCLTLTVVLPPGDGWLLRGARLGLPLSAGGIVFLITARLAGLQEPLQLLGARRRDAA